MPLDSISIGQSRLGTLGVENVSKFASTKRDLGLNVVELIILRVQCIHNGFNIFFRVQHVPGSNASLSLAGFQNKKYRVETVDNFC